jgi:glutamine synthetase
VLVAFDPQLGMPAAAADPRLAALRLNERLRGRGLNPVMAVELEFYLLSGDSATLRPPRPVLPRGEHPHVYGIEEIESFAPFLDEVYRACDEQGLPAETAISEFGPGQLEITLMHRADALRALDEAVLFRRLVKGVAARHGYIACFMAKPFAKCAGSGTHLHLSLTDDGGRNLFASEDPAGTPLLRFAIGGMAESAADMMAVFAPHANSYRRYCANSYAPLFPTWGINNRTVSLRVPTGAAETRHVEHRICGADANPYLAAAALLAGVDHGIAREIEPGEPVAGDGYQVTDAPPLPVHWPLAIERFAQSALAREYFGKRFVEIYAAVKRTESQRFLGEVTTQDCDWYLQTV